MKKDASNSTPNDHIYMVKSPLFFLHFKDEDGLMGEKLCIIPTYNLSFEEICNKHKGDNIFFYKEEKNPEVYSRVYIVPNEYNWEIIDVTYPNSQEK